MRDGARSERRVVAARPWLREREREIELEKKSEARRARGRRALEERGTAGDGGGRRERRVAG